MKILFSIFLLISTLFSDKLILDNLLNQYEDSESMYKKTKKDSAGFLLIYSREDLERMQAFTLQDILKTIRMHTLQTNIMGATTILNSGSGRNFISPIKIYIDDFEISTVTQKNALDMYGSMDIYFVDHIEIYQGGSSIAFGNEPGSMVIRLYSKNPKRENSTSIELSVDSKAGGNLRILDAGTSDGFNYLAYASVSKLQYNSYTKNKHELSRDAKRYQAHFKFSKDDDFTIELDGILKKTDVFNGFGAAPIGGDTTKAYGYVSIIKYFPNNVELSLSATQEKKEVTNTDAMYIPSSINKSVHIDVYSNTYKTSLKKKILSGKNDLLFGVEFQKKLLDVHDFNGISRKAILGSDELNVYMVFLEEMYNINKNHIITLSAKLDRYDNNYSKDSNEYSLRLGYAGILGNNFSTKLFAIRRYVYPSIFQTSFTPLIYIGNPNLNSAKVDMLSGEIEYNNNKTRLVYGFAYKEVNNALLFNKMKKMYVNSKDTIYYHRHYVRGEYKFDYKNKVILEVYKGFKGLYASPGSGALLQVFNTFGKFDIYNELVYRDGYSLNYGAGNVDMDKGYDYTLAITYNVNKKLKVKFKGENLLDKASKTLMDPKGLVRVPIVERRGIFTMEYTF